MVSKTAAFGVKCIIHKHTSMGLIRLLLSDFYEQKIGARELETGHRTMVNRYMADSPTRNGAK
jgi:hypothetical protein